MFYFAILVGLAAHYSNVSIQDRNDMTATLSISMAIMMIILCTGIVLSLILDIILSIRKKSVIHQKLEEMEDDKQVQVIRKSRNIGFLVRYLKGNDPLYFRAETLLIVMTVIFTIVLYSVGIGSVMEQSTAMSPIVIVRTVIEIIMMFMEIVAFGGFVFAMTLNNYIRLKRSKYEIQENEQNNKNEDGLLEMIRNELGYQIVHQYCQMEFSLENLLLWKELEHLRSRNLVMTSDERKQTLQYINELYIKNNSERQLNIANKERKKFLKILEQDDLNGSDTEQALETLYDVCLANLSETAIRLRSSELYQDYLTIREAHQELKISF
jgi:large-conductance mechanosensitive channel